MDGTHKHAIHASRWFILPCLVHIALLLIYLPSSRSHHLTGVYLSCLVSLLVAVHVHVHMCMRSVRPFDICVCVCDCMPVSICVCVNDILFDMTGGDLPSVFSILFLSWHEEHRSLLSWWQRWLTASVSHEDRFVWSVFLYYLDSFPRVFVFSTHICACACSSAFPAWVKLTSMHFLLPLRLRTVTHVDTLLIPPTTELFGLCKTGMIIF